MNGPRPDQDLMHGIVAVRECFLEAAEFVDVFSEWSGGQRTQPLLIWLAKRGRLTESQCARVDSLVRGASVDEFATLAPESQATEITEAIRARIDTIDEQHTRDELVDLITLISPDSSQPPSNPPPIASEQNRFHVRKELARGGLGQVFIARDKQLNRNVALKQILERWQDDTNSNDRFLTEAEITGRLEHPGVVPVYALGYRPDGRYFYAMRLIRGVTLEDEIKTFFDSWDSQTPSERNLALRKLLRRFIDVCNTLEYAHSRGVIHRDLKPANIMLGKYGETLVVDWGLAKQVDVKEERHETTESLLVPSSGSGSSATRMGSALGTPQFMSPEQAAGQLDIVGPASDIYGLGATFYQLLTGRPPQTDTSLPKILEKVKRGEFPKPSTVRATVPKPLEAICIKAMQREACNRYTSAGEMAQDIERWLADQRVLSYEEPLLSRSARYVRRHQALVASATVATLLICIAFVIASIAWQKAESNRRAQDYKIQQEQSKREQEERQRLTQRRSSALANLDFGLVEAKSGQFESALRFFRQGQQECLGEPSLSDELQRLSIPAEQMEQLAEFERLSDESIMSSALQEDLRTIDLIASALRKLGVFDHADWWEHLPVQYLSRQEADRIETHVHFQLVTLATLLSKGATPATLFSQPPERRQLVMNAVERAVMLAQSYRESEWLRQVAAIGLATQQRIDAVPDKQGQWRGETFCDAYYLGATCGMVAELGNHITAVFIKQQLGVTGSREDALLYLRRATRLDPNSYLALILLAFVQTLEEQYEDARITLDHAVALRPDLILAYDWRSISAVKQARQSSDPRQRIPLLQEALRDANTVCQLKPRFEIGYWMRGDALRELGQHSLAIQAYMNALQREPPVDMIDADDLIFTLRGRQLHEVRRLGDLLPSRFADARRYSQELRAERPDDPWCLILDATAAMSLQQWDDAEELAQETLDLASIKETPEAWDENLTRIVAQAHAVLGEVSRNKGGMIEANAAFTESKRLDPQNSLAAEGKVLVLGRLVSESDDPLVESLAEKACDELMEVGCTDWQIIRAHRGRFALQLRKGNAEAAAETLASSLAIDRGQDLREMRRLAEQHQADKIIKRLRDLDVIAQLGTGFDLNQQPHSLALRNADFELGLDQYWESWNCVGGCFAEARAVNQTHSQSKGSRSLMIQHHTERHPGSQASLQQALPIVPGASYRISLWAKGQGVSEDAFRLLVENPNQSPVIVLPKGTYDWKSLKGEFEVQGSVDFSQTFTKFIKIESVAPGQVWLDDIRIERIVDR